MKDVKKLPETYGEKPASLSFTFEDIGVTERYYLGSEVSILYFAGILIF
jgi:hypothetical protein